MSTRTTPPMNFDHYDLGCIRSAVEVLDDAGVEFAGTIRTGAAVLTVRFNADQGLHQVTKIEPRP